FDLRVNARAAVSTDRFDRPDDPLQQIDCVNPLIHHRPAAVEFPRAAPRDFFVITIRPKPRRETAGPRELAESVFAHRLLDRAILILPSPLENAGEFYLVLVG